MKFPNLEKDTSDRVKAASLPFQSAAPVIFLGPPVIGVGGVLSCIYVPDACGRTGGILDDSNTLFRRPSRCVVCVCYNEPTSVQSVKSFRVVFRHGFGDAIYTALHQRDVKMKLNKDDGSW